MQIEVLASGSSGNVTAVWSGKELFLIDCGKPYKWTMTRLKGELPDAILITHEHGDHAKAVEQFMKRQVEMYMTAGTAEKLDLSIARNLHIIRAGEQFELCGVKVLPIESVHDAKEPVNFILEDLEERVLFVTDTGATPELTGKFDRIYIEANYAERRLMWSDTSYFLKERILQTHLSIEAVEKFLSRHPESEVTLLHVSQRHGDKAEFYSRIGAIGNGKSKFELNSMARQRSD